MTKNELYYFWIKSRDAAGIVADVRLHDLHHAHASHAVMIGESVHVAGRLLGHPRASTTNRYVHLDDATLSLAAEHACQPFCLRSANIPSARQPQSWTPEPRSLIPVAMMISSHAGRIFSTAFSDSAFHPGGF